MHNWLELLFCSQCLAGQLLAPTYFWRAHKYSTKILCSSPLVLEMKAVGGSRTDFCLELEQLLHLQPGTAQDWSECPVWPQGWQESWVEMELCLGWSTLLVTSSAPILSGQCCVQDLELLVFPWGCVTALISLWLLEKPTKMSTFLSQTFCNSSLAQWIPWIAQCEHSSTGKHQERNYL